MGYEVSKRSAPKLKKLMAERPPIKQPPMKSSAGTRYDCHVVITGAEQSDGYFPCHVVAYDPLAEDWTEFTAEGKALDCNDRELVQDKRYRALCYGQSGDALVYVVQAHSTCFRFVYDTSCVDGELIVDYRWNVDGEIFEEDPGVC